jgi:MYXO-CTERM domain-containing protein
MTLLGAAMTTLGHAALIHQYDLNASLVDNFGGPALVNQGGTLGATSFEFSPTKGLKGNATGVNEVYTVDFRLTLDASCLNVQCKIFDFTTAASRYTVFSDSYGNRTTDLSFSRDSIGNLTLRVNGLIHSSFLDSAGAYALSPVNNTFWLFEGFPGSNSGSLDWVRIFNAANDAANYVETAAHAPEPSSVLLGVIALGALALRRRFGK